MLTITADQIKQMNDGEIVGLLTEDSLLSRVRKIFYSEAARIDQASKQRKPPSIIEIRRMELIAASRIMYEIDLVWNSYWPED